MVAKVDDLNVRAGSSTKHKVLGKLNKGDKVTVIQTLSNGWIKIEYKGGFGYVSNVKGAYLQPIDDTQDKKSADKVISLIDSLNVKITLADKADIIKAREAYDALSEKAKDLVTNLNKLTDAEKEIARLEAEVDSVKDMLANLPSPDMLTVDDIDTINALSTAYNKLTPEQKKLAIPDETVLTEYMLVCDKLEKAQPIIKMIDALPKVNAIKIADKNKVQEVRKAYNNATTGSVNAGVAKYITNYNKLVKLENKIVELEAGIDNVKDMLTNLPSPDMVTVDDIDTINALSSAYNKLTPEQKKLAIPDEMVLMEYEFMCDRLEKAQPIIKMIEALPEVDAIQISDKDKVQKVRKAYNNATTGSLNAGVDKYITNYNKLVQLENKIAELEAIS